MHKRKETELFNYYPMYLSQIWFYITLKGKLYIYCFFTLYTYLFFLTFKVFCSRILNAFPISSFLRINSSYLPKILNSLVYSGWFGEEEIVSHKKYFVLFCLLTCQSYALHFECSFSSLYFSNSNPSSKSSF